MNLGEHWRDFADLWQGAMWRACWQGGVAIGVAWIFTRWLRQIPPIVRCWIWRLALLKLLTALFWFNPLDVPLLPAGHALDQTELTRPASPSSSPPAGNAAGFAPTESTSEAPPARTNAFKIGNALALAWLLGFGIAAGRLLKSWTGVLRMRSSAKPAASEVSDLFHCVSRAFGLKKPPVLLTHSHLRSPVLTGIFRPAVVVPCDFAVRYSKSEQRLMLAHELAHCRRRDLLWNWVPALAQLLFFFFPPLWLARREWSLAQETACDELALKCSKESSPSEYAEMLLRVIQQERETKWGVVAAIGIGAWKRTIKRRILAMKDFRPMTRHAVFLWSTMISISALMIIVPWRLVAASEENPQQRADGKNAAGEPKSTEVRDPGPGQTPGSSVSAEPAAASQADLLREEILLVNQLVGSIERQREAGRATLGDLIAARRELLQVQQELARVEGRLGDIRKLIREEISAVDLLLKEQSQRIAVGASHADSIIPLQREVLSLKRRLVSLGSEEQKPQASEPNGYEELIRNFVQNRSFRQNPSLKVSLIENGLDIAFLNRPGPLFDTNGKITEYAEWLLRTIAWEVTRIPSAEVELRLHSQAPRSLASHMDKILTNAGLARSRLKITTASLESSIPTAEFLMLIRVKN